MGNVVLIKSDNTAVWTSRQTVMQRDKLTGSLTVVTARYYNDFDMEDFDLVMTYKTPSSNTLRTAPLALDSESYGDVENMLSYRVAVDTGITAESGDVGIQFMFVRSYVDAETGDSIQQVRNIEETTLHVCELQDYFVNTDAALSDLAEIYLRNQQQILALKALADQINANNVADLSIDSSRLVLINENGATVGSGLSLEALNDELVETGGDTSGNVSVVEI